jgi:hypothetical protein
MNIRKIAFAAKSLSEKSDGPCFHKKGWMARRDEGAYPQWSVTEEQRSQPALFVKTLRATGLFGEAFVGSTVTARCGDAPVSPPRPPLKSLVAGPIPFFRQAQRSVPTAAPTPPPFSTWHTPCMMPCRMEHAPSCERASLAVLRCRATASRHRSQPDPHAWHSVRRRTDC